MILDGDNMIKKGLSQEALKLIACITMLIDHMAAVFGFALKWRVIGRLAFPIYCFLLAEGAHHTRNSKKYALRLAIGALLAEIPFDFAFFGRLYWGHQNVMLTLLLGFFALKAIEKCGSLPTKLLSAIPFAALAALMNTDYGWQGVLLIALFGLVRERPEKWAWLIAGMSVLFMLIPSSIRMIFGMRVPIQIFGLASLVPMWLYSGEKASGSKLLQWGFYLFYPAHMLLLWLAKLMINF